MAKRYKVTSRVRARNAASQFMAKRDRGSASLLAVAGRTTGERHVIAVSPVRIDDATYVVAPYGDVNWVLNIRVNPKVTLSRGGATSRFTAAEVGKEEGGKVLARYYADNAKSVGDFMDIPGEHTIVDFTSVADQYPVFRLE